MYGNMKIGKETTKELMFSNLSKETTGRKGCEMWCNELTELMRFPSKLRLVLVSARAYITRNEYADNLVAG